MSTSLTSVERAVLANCLLKAGLADRFGILDHLEVTRREWTGVGFRTDIHVTPPDEFLFADRRNLLWKQAGVLNGTILVGYLVWVDAGRLATIEGFVYPPPDEYPADPVECRLTDWCVVTRAGV